MATLRVRLKKTGGTEPLRQRMTVVVTTSDGTYLDGATKTFLGGPKHLADGAKWSPTDLTDPGISPAGILYKLTVPESSDIGYREWYWDGHLDKSLSELPTFDAPVQSGPIYAPYDDSQLRSRLNALEDDTVDWAEVVGKPTIPSTPGQVGADPAGSADTALMQAKAYADALDVDLSALIALAEESDDIAALADAVQALADAEPDVTQEELDAEAQARVSGNTTTLAAAAADAAAKVATEASARAQGDADTLAAAKVYADQIEAEIRGGAGPAWDTLQEIKGLIDAAQAGDASAFDTLTAAISTKIPSTAKGAAGGVAPLDSGLVVPDANLPARLTLAQLAAAYAPVQDTQALIRLERQTVQSVRYLGQRAAARVADATFFTEAWTDLSQWGYKSNAAVSGGKVIGATNAAYLLNRAINVPAGSAGGRFMARAVLHNFGNTGAGGAYAYIGVTNDAAGGTPDPGNANGLYIGISATGASSIVKGSNLGGSLDSTSLPVLPAGDYVATIIVDETDVALTMQKMDGSVVSQTRIRRTNFNVGANLVGGVNNLSIVGSGNDTSKNVITSMVWGNEITVPTLAAHRTVNGVPMFTTPSVLGAAMMNEIIMPDVSGATLFLPPNLDPRVPAPVVVYLHGAGGSSYSAFTVNKELNVLNALLAAGYIVVAGNGGPVGSWDRYGNPAAVADAVQVLSYVRSHFNTGAAFLWGVSMGTEALINFLAARTGGGIAAAILTCPALDLVNIEANAGYTAAIRTAYGAADRADFLTKISGKNPIDYPARLLRDTPLSVHVASDDTLADPAIHWYPLRDRLLAAGASDVVTRVVTGGHVGGASYWATNYLATFEKYRYAA